MKWHRADHLVTTVSILVLLGGLGFYTALSLLAIRAATTHVIQAQETETAIETMRADFYALDGALNMYLMVHGGPLARPTLAFYSAKRAGFVKAYGQAYLLADAADRSLLRVVREDFAGYSDYARKVFTALGRGDARKAAYLQTQGNAEATDAVSEALGRASYHAAADAHAAAIHSDTAVARTFEWVGTVGLIALIGALAVGAYRRETRRALLARHEARHDPLTGLLNRAGLQDWSQLPDSWMAP